MNGVSRCLLGVSLVAALGTTAAAQGNPPPPKIIVISREYVKPGKAGMAHEKTESLFVQAMSRAKWPTHYLGMTSLSGKQRALFLSQYASFDAWEKDSLAMEKNPALSAAMDHASVVDGELLDSMDQGVFVYHEEMSLRPMADISHMRYLDISAYQVRPGHTGEWNELVKLVKAAYETGVPSAHWGMYQLRYGGEGGYYIVLTARKSLAELDQAPMLDQQFAAAMGEAGMKRLNELVASAVETSQHQLFAFSAEMSYVEESWIKAEPAFWKPKRAAAPAAKSATEAKKAKP